MVEFKCERCGNDFARKDILTRHINRKYPCGGANTPYQRDSSVSRKSRFSADCPQDVSARQEDIQTFDGAEFSGEKPKSRETLLKMMEMLKIPEHRREKIATDMLKEDATMNTQRNFSTRNDEGDADIADEDTCDSVNEKCEPLYEAESQEMTKAFQQLYSDQVKKGRRENVPDLIDILNIWREDGQIDQDRYDKVLTKIKTI